MQEIKDLFEKISEELDGAKHYAEEALRMRDIDSEKANMFLQMSRQELDHVDKLHEMVKKTIKTYKDQGGKVPEGMEIVYDWQHKKMMDCVAKIRYLHDMIK